MSTQIPLTWHRLTELRAGDKLTELLAASQDDGIGIIARWTRRSDDTWHVEALDTENETWQVVVHFDETEAVPPKPPVCEQDRPAFDFDIFSHVAAFALGKDPLEVSKEERRTGKEIVMRYEGQILPLHWMEALVDRLRELDDDKLDEEFGGCSLNEIAVIRMTLDALWNYLPRPTTEATPQVETQDRLAKFLEWLDSKDYEICENFEGPNCAEWCPLTDYDEQKSLLETFNRECP